MIKNKCKKTVSAMLLMTMIVTTFSVDVFAAPKHSEGGLLSDNSTYTDEAKSIKEVTIGNEIESKKIEDIVVIPKKEIKSVSIKDGVTRISNYAFSGCTGLTSITIPNSVTFIGDYAFQGCESLTLVTIYNGKTKVSKNAFKQCIKLKSIVIPNSVQSNDETTKVVKDNEQSIDLQILDELDEDNEQSIDLQILAELDEAKALLKKEIGLKLGNNEYDIEGDVLEGCYELHDMRATKAAQRSKCNCFACCFACCERQEYSGYKGNTFGGIKVTRDL